MKYFLLILLLGIILVGGCVAQQKTTPTGKAITPTEEVKEFEITAKQFSFEPNTITVNKGDKVRLKVKSTDVTHGIAIDEFNVNKRIEPGKTVDVEFVADKTGTFIFYCSVFCGNRHSEQIGKLIVSGGY